jgi:hypothetical protein
MRHWPEQLLAKLLLGGSWGVALFAPGGSLVKVALILGSWVFAFGTWAGTIWVVCWLHRRREGGKSEPGALPDPRRQ